MLTDYRIFSEGPHGIGTDRELEICARRSGRDVYVTIAIHNRTERTFSKKPRKPKILAQDIRFRVESWAELADGLGITGEAASIKGYVLTRKEG